MSVEARVEKIEIPTYMWGPEDPNPPFQRRGYWNIYPYRLMDDLGEESRPMSYRALVLENEYLRVTVLPELGGRLYSAVDKPTGREIFYRNHVVKPGLIALRGAWISGGIEFNFPRGHTVTTVSPVDSRLVEEENGSATAWVGNLEQIYRMGWAVGIRLRPGSSVIETEVRLTNRTALPHPYYFWANSAMPARPDMHMVYPCTRVRVWSNVLNWPVHEGRNLAAYGAHGYQGDIFALDSLEDFFGVYYEETDFGLVHVANVHDAYGKKHFTWGVSDHGKVWAEALSDGDGPYCELQSGRFVDQGVWRMLPPHHGVGWREHWYAVKGTGGFSWANERAVVHVAEEEGRVECGVLVTEPRRGASIRLSVDGRAVHEERADLAPDRPRRIAVARQPGWPAGPVTLTVADGSGAEIIRYGVGQQPRTLALQEPVKASAPDGPGVGELLADGLKAEQRGEPEDATQLYERVLAKDPKCTPAAIALGRMAIENGLESAVERLSAAATAAPESGEAAYYLGLALSRSGSLQEAEFQLWRAAQDPGFAHAARVELGLIALRQGEPAEAARRFGESLDYGAHDVRARCMLAAALRRSGRTKEAMAEVSAALKTSPHDRLASMEAYFCAAALDRPRIAGGHLRRLTELVPASSDPWLELGFDYAAAGLWEEAVTLLGQGVKRSTAVRQCPLGHYAMGYWLEQLGRCEEAAEARAKATQLDPRYVFPHQWEVEAVLKAAIAAEPADGPAHYYLGNLLYAKGRREEGLRAWEEAAKHLDGFAVVFRNLGFGFRETMGDLAQAEVWLRRAVNLVPGEPRAYLELCAVLRERNSDPRERLAVLDGAPESVRRRGVMAGEQAVACMAAGEWDRAIALLRTHSFHRWEMEFRMRRIWVEANLGRACERFVGGDLKGAREDAEAALEYPRNLRIGKPPRRRDARPQWCAGVACEAMGDAVAARAHWEEAAAEEHHHAGTEEAVYRALSLRKLGRGEEAKQLLDESLRVMEQCAEMAPDDANAHLALGMVRKACGQAEAAAESLRRALEMNPWLPRARQLLDSDVVV